LINDDLSDDCDLVNEQNNQSNHTNQKNHSSDNLPKGWKWVKISDVAQVNPPLPNKVNIDKNLEVQFLPMKLVEEIINKIHLIETRKFSDVLKGSYTPFIDGDIIFAKVTPCMENGKIAIVNKLKNGIGFGSSEFHVLRSTNAISNTYLHYFIVQDKFRNEAESAMTGAVGLRRVPKKFIEDYIIPLPPTLPEQTQIVQEIESRLSVCDKMEQSINESIEKAEALRQSILKKAFEGKLLSQAELAQCKAAADYEPASELLKKIQAEKLAKEQEKKKSRKNGK
jgi:type I restriction enzyme S subunit